LPGLNYSDQFSGFLCKFDALVWPCFPNGVGQIKSDLNRENARVALELIQFRAVSQTALDETWSALRGRPHNMVGK
jgi:hypothetical protein